MNLLGELEIEFKLDTYSVETGYYKLQAETPGFERSFINLLLLVEEIPEELPEIKKIKTQYSAKDASVNFNLEGERLSFTIAGDELPEGTSVTLISECDENGENRKVPLTLSNAKKNGKKIVCKAEVGAITNGVFAVMVETPSGTQISYIELKGKKCKASILDITQEEITDRFYRPENFVKVEKEEEVIEEKEAPQKFNTDPIILTNLGINFATDLNFYQLDAGLRLLDFKWVTLDAGGFYNPSSSFMGLYGSMSLAIPIRFFSPYIGGGVGYFAYDSLKNMDGYYFPFFAGITLFDIFDFRYNCNLNMHNLSQANSNLEYFEDSVGIGFNIKIRSGTSIKRVENANAVGDNAYFNCYKLNYINFTEYVTSIGDDAFYYCTSLKVIRIPENVKSIGKRAFYNCSNLTNVHLTYGLESIGSRAFSNCTSLTTITIPSSVTKIAKDAFEDSGIKTIHVDWSRDDTTERDRGWIRNFKGTILYANKNTVRIEEFPSYINNIAFSKTPKTVKIVGTLLPSSFSIIKETLQTKDEIDLNLDISSSLAVTAIPEMGLGGCTNIISLILPATLEKIGKNAFANCSSLASVNIPKKVTLIESAAFAACASLKEIDFPSEINNLNDNLFANCVSLQKVVLPQNLSIIGKSVFSNCIALTSISIPFKVTLIDERAFSGCSNLEEIILPESVLTIGASAFYRCERLKSIVLPENLLILKDYTFFGCSNIESIIIPKNVTKISKWAFAGCSNLTSIVIPPSIKTIEEYVFESCSSLQTINLDWASTDTTVRDLAGLKGIRATIKYSDGVIYK